MQHLSDHKLLEDELYFIYLGNPLAFRDIMDKHRMALKDSTSTLKMHAIVHVAGRDPSCIFLGRGCMAFIRFSKKVYDPQTKNPNLGEI